MAVQRRTKTENPTIDEEWARFGQRVEEARKAAGLDREDLAMREACSAEGIRRIEAGEHDPSSILVGYFDSKMQAHGSLLNAWARARINTHLAAGKEPRELDSGAQTLREFHPGQIPSGLQTMKYAEALGRVQGRHGQRPSMHSQNTTYRIVLTESVLRTPVGGAQVMYEQLDRLVKGDSNTRTCVQVIPDGTCDDPCATGSFRLLTLGPAYTVAHLVCPVGPGQLITRPDQIRSYSDLFEDLRAVALSGADSKALLVRLRDSFADVPGPGPERKEITSGSAQGPAAHPTHPAPAQAHPPRP